LALYRSALHNFNNILTNFDLILHKFFNLKFNFIIYGDINIKYPVESYKKYKLDDILHSFNLSSIVNIPTRIGPNSISTIYNVFIDNSHLNKFVIISLIISLSDHDAQILTIQFVQKHNKGQWIYFNCRLPTRTQQWQLEFVFEGNNGNVISFTSLIFKFCITVHIYLFS